MSYDLLAIEMVHLFSIPFVLLKECISYNTNLVSFTESKKTIFLSPSGSLL